MISVGDRMPTSSRVITMTDMIAYAGATWDWHQLHYDPAYLAARNLPAPVVDGQAFGAYFAADLESWLGPVCFIRELDFTYRNLMYAGETLRIDAQVTEVSGSTVRVALTAVILASEYGAERPAVHPAHATVELGVIDGEG